MRSEKVRDGPKTRTMIPNDTNAAPRGWESLWMGNTPSFAMCELVCEIPNIWTRALKTINISARDFTTRLNVPTPAVASAKLVRRYERKVRSEARWSRATLPEFLSMIVGLNRCRSFEVCGKNDSPCVAVLSSVTWWRRLWVNFVLDWGEDRWRGEITHA